MSLETVIAGLVSACNALTDTVNKKISLIDQRVAAATEQVPAAVRAEVNKALYVDSSSGVDTNSGLTPDKPLKTIAAAVSRVMLCGSATIFLRRGKVYEVGRGLGGTNVDNMSILFVPYGTEASKPIVRGALVRFSDSNTYVCGGFSAFTEMSIKFTDCRIETGLANGVTQYGPDYGGLFTRDGGFGESVSFKLFFHKCEVVVQDVPLFSTYYGFIQLSLAQTTISKGGTQSTIVNVGVPKMVDISSVSIVGFGAGATLDNLLTLAPGSYTARQVYTTISA
ncbi:hypothetical protein HX797_04560 [Pseudomonas edaphica]|uniref:Uncharacterized protein n=1 Tax=Pseudomonas edaphica TaxID=2006980 RepID=A0A7Y7RNS3_9PSED|nr:hypothetical protein [Pseudomonas edaphica]NVZ55526.1 hypothetical protein [Pseudomonas edaphica]